MSKSTLPEETMKTETPIAAFAGDMTEMQKDAIEWMAGATAPQFAGVANLAAHPMGAMAAASAIGMGMAGQMFGIFAGSMAGVMQAANLLANDTTGGRSEIFGMANPLNFDPASGSFDETKEPDTVAAKPAAAKKPVEAKKPVAEKKPAPKKTAPAKPEPVKEEVKAEAPAAKPKKAKPAPAKTAPAKTSAAKTPAAKPAAAKSAPAEPAVAATPEPVALVEPTRVEETPVASGTIEPVMPEDFVKPKAIAKPDTPDDLKAISGVGPKLEGVLNSLGIWTYGQIAALTPYEVAWVDDYLQFKGRIERDGWIAQAADLAKKA